MKQADLSTTNVLINARLKNVAALVSQSLTKGRLFLMTVVLASVVYFQFDIWNQPVVNDRAIWEYVAQVIARGGAPYKDVVEIKSPASAYIGAAAIVLTRPFGIRETFAIRATFLVLAILTAGFVFLVTVEYFGSRSLAVLAAFIFIGFDSVPITNSAGIQPKTAMMLFGLAALWAIKKDFVIAAGMLSMLSALSWQPGLLFLGAAGLAITKYLTNWRDKRLLKLLAGSLIPLIFLLIHLWALGALRDSYLWTIHYNLTVYAPAELKPINRFFEFLGKMASAYYQREAVFLYLAAIGVVIFIARDIWIAAKTSSHYLLDRSRDHAVAIAPLAYLAFCAINVQAGGDAAPFVPYISVFAAFTVVVFLNVALELLARVGPVAFQPTLRVTAMAILCGMVYWFNIRDAFGYRAQFPTLQDQEADIREIVSLVGPDEKVFMHDVTEVLVLSGLQNVGRHIFLDRGKDDYMIHVEEGGFEGWFVRLKAERPKVVAFDRMRKVIHRRDFMRWVEDDYERRRGRVLTYYVRKDRE
jgi:hypothetical protein